MGEARHGCLLCAVLLGLGSGVAHAQSGLGVLTGRVIDSDSLAPLPDVVVIATSPGLQGEQSGLTDSAGTYRLPQLPIGVYTLRFERGGHRPYRRDGIELRADQTIRLNVELLPESISQDVLIVGRPPTVDVGSTQTGLVIGSDFAERIPIVRSTQGGLRDVQDLALAAPQTQRDLYGVAINGTTSPENQYLLDGLSVNDTGYGPSGTPFSVEFAQELNVITGGYLPEYGRTNGGVLSVISKSGGNEFHGSVFGTYSPGALAQAGQTVTDDNTIFGSRTTLHNAGDLGFTLGGYLIKDRVWFFVGFNPSFERDSLVRTVSVFDVNTAGQQIPIPGGFQRTEVASASRRYFQDTHTYPFFTKLTFLLSPEHHLSVAFSGAPYEKKTPFLDGMNGTYDALGQSSHGGSYDSVAQLSSSFAEKKLLLDVVLGWHHQTNNNHAIDNSWLGSGVSTVSNVVWDDPQNLSNFAGREPGYSPELAAICAGPAGAARCQVAGYTTGGPDGLLAEIVENRVQAKAVLTGLFQALGHHIVKAGVDVDLSLFDKTTLSPGVVSYFGGGTPANGRLESDQWGHLGGPDRPVVSADGTFSARTESLTLGGFIQDSWSVLDRVTVNLGLRYDAQTIYGSDGRVAMVLNNEWGPRLGLIWDPSGQGRAKVFASYAWYYEQVPLRLADLDLVRRSLVDAVYTGCRDPSVPANGPCAQQASVARIPGGAGPSRYWSVFNGKEQVDPSITAQRTDELVAGLEYALVGATRVSFTYTHRNLAHGLEDFSLDEGASFWIGNPGQGIGSSLIRPERIYNGYTVSLSKAFDQGWLGQASYTYSTLEGNVAGFYNPEASARITDILPNVNSDFDLPALRVNRFGPLPSDARHQIKLHGAYQLQLSPAAALTFGAAYNARSGAPISAFGGYPAYGGNAVYLIPRGAVGRLPWVHQVDLHGTLDVRLSPSTTLSVGADCFNVLGSQQVVSVDQSYVAPPQTQAVPIPNGTIADLPSKLVVNGSPIPASNLNPNFGRPTAWQTPRSVRLLARVSF